MAYSLERFEFCTALLCEGLNRAQTLKIKEVKNNDDQGNAETVQEH